MRKDPGTEPGKILKFGNNGKIQLVSVRQDALTVRKRAAFLDHLAGTCNVTHSALAVGVDPACFHRYRRRHPEFASLWRDAVEAGYDRLQELLIQRASGMVDTPIGETPVPDITKMDTELAMRLLESHRRTVMGGKRGGGVKIRQATEEETNAAIIKKLRVLARRSRRPAP